jgi:hypothetical protein
LFEGEQSLGEIAAFGDDLFVFVQPGVAGRGPFVPFREAGLRRLSELLDRSPPAPTPQAQHVIELQFTPR